MVVQHLITWRLKELMSANKLSVAEMARRLGVSDTAVIKLRRSDMPRINGERLNQIIMVLNATRKKGKPPIGVSDLIVLTFSMSEVGEAKINE